MSNAGRQTDPSGVDRVTQLRVSHERLCALVNRCIKKGGIIENIPEAQAIIESLDTFEAFIPVPAPPEVEPPVSDTQGGVSVG